MRSKYLALFALTTLVAGFGAAGLQRRDNAAPAARWEAVAMERAASEPSPLFDSAEVVKRDDLPKVRQAARDLVRAVHPSAKTDGVFVLSFGRGGTLYLAGVDTQINGRRRVIDVLVRLFVRKTGGSYWRAEPLSPDEAAKLRVTATQQNTAAAE